MSTQEQIPWWVKLGKWTIFSKGTFRFCWLWDSAHFLCVPWASHFLTFHLALWARNKFHQLQGGIWQVIQIKDNLRMNVPGATSHTASESNLVSAFPNPFLVHVHREHNQRVGLHIGNFLTSQLLRDPIISFLVVIGIRWWWDWNPQKYREHNVVKCQQTSMALVPPAEAHQGPALMTQYFLGSDDLPSFTGGSAHFGIPYAGVVFIVSSEGGWDLVVTNKHK